MEGLVDLNIKAPIIIPSPNNRDVEKGDAGEVPDLQGMILSVHTCIAVMGFQPNFGGYFALRLTSS